MRRSEGFVTAARLGMGWGMAPEALLSDDLARGTLHLMRADCPLDTPLYWQWSRLLGPALAPVTRALRRGARRSLRMPQDLTKSGETL